MADSKENKIKEYKGLLNKMFGKNSGIIIEDPDNIVIEKFPTGSYILDKDLKGGWAKGTVIEIFGDSGSGKTTTCIHAVSEHQKKYPEEPVLWIDLEKVFDPVYFKTLGININSENFILLRPYAGEDVWESIIAFTKEFKKGIIIIDSISLILPKKEEEGMVEDHAMASAARLNSKALRKLFPHIHMGGTTIFAINQIRKNIGGYGDPNVTTGGEALKYYCRTRIATSKSKGELGEYSNNKFKQLKSNYGNQDVVTETSIEYGIGFNKTKELLRLAVENEIVNKGGSWFSYGDIKLGQGEDNVVILLNDNPELFDEIFKKIMDGDQKN